MNVNAAFPSKYLKAEGDIPDEGNLILTIRKCVMETVGSDDDQETKPVLYFEETDKGLVLNRTNSNTITGLLGTPETDEWRGQRIALFSTEVAYGGRQVLGIRVRMKKPQQAAPRPVAAAVAAQDEGDPFSDDD